VVPLSSRLAAILADYRRYGGPVYVLARRDGPECTPARARLAAACRHGDAGAADRAREDLRLALSGAQQPGPQSPARVSQLAGEHLRGCGIDVELHTLRHRFGMVLLARSKDLRLVQECLGHSSPAITAVYTAIWYDDEARRAVEDVAELALRPAGG